MKCVTEQTHLSGELTFYILTHFILVSGGGETISRSSVTPDEARALPGIENGNKYIIGVSDY